MLRCDTEAISIELLRIMVEPSIGINYSGGLAAPLMRTDILVIIQESDRCSVQSTLVHAHWCQVAML